MQCGKPPFEAKSTSKSNYQLLFDHAVYGSISTAVVIIGTIKNWYYY